MIKVLHVGASDSVGGAARASYRVHRALVDHGEALGLSSRFLVDKKLTDDLTVIASTYDPWSKPISMARRILRRALHRVIFFRFRTTNQTLHSIACVSHGLIKTLNRLREDANEIVNLHWIAADTLSIEEIGRLRGAIVWRMADQWPFCGAEHYVAPPKPGERDSHDRRFILGYSRDSREAGESGFDVNRWVWRRKKRAWRRPMHVVCTTQWMADCVKASALMAHWPVHVIPNPIDLDSFSPADRDESRRLLGLPTDRPLILFGAVSATSDSRKGADLLMDGLAALRKAVEGTPLASFELVIFGAQSFRTPIETEFEVHFFGHVEQTETLRRLYAAADVFVIPSRQEAFGNTAAEAQACGTPVVAFAGGGPAEIIADDETGKLAARFDPISLAEAIHWVMEDGARNHALGHAARLRAQALFNSRRIAMLYAEVYAKALNEKY